MYSSRHKLEMFQTSWEFRKELIKADVISASSDIVCFQEVCAGFWLIFCYLIFININLLN